MPSIIALDAGATFQHWNGNESVTYVKHNDRQLRKPHEACGKDGGYWAHRVGSTNGKPCFGHGDVMHGWVHVSTMGIPCMQAPKSALGEFKPATPSSVFGKPAETASTSEAPKAEAKLPTPTFAPVSVPLPAGDDADRAKALMDILMRPSVTPEQVRDMVKSAVEDRDATILSMVQDFIDDWKLNQHAPTSVEVKWSDRATVKIDNCHPKFEKILRLALMGSNILMVGPMGSGKSTIARNLATALDRKSLIFTCSIGTTKSDILGYMAADGYHASPFATAWERGYVICMDELDTLHPQVSPIVNDAFAAKELQFPNGKTDDEGDLIPVKLGEGGIIVAAANTVGRGADREYVGRNKIDAATLDRFTLVAIDYDMALEDMLVAKTGASSKVQTAALKVCRDLRKAAAANKIAANYGVRAMVDICRMVQAGFSHDEIVFGRLSRGMSDADWKTLTRAVDVPVLAA